MTDDELREAVEILERDGYWGENENVKAFDSLLSFVQQYLSIKGFPEEKWMSIGATSLNSEKERQNYANGFNEALRLCKLAKMKEKNKVSKEEIDKILDICFPNAEEEADDYELRGDNGDYVPLEKEKFLMKDFGIGLLEDLQEKLANALLEMINGKE